VDLSTWHPHYLPAWSSRAATRASHQVVDGSLVLDVPVDHPLWCPGEHEPPLRVSGMQSGSWSGPAGSTRGEQPARSMAALWLSGVEDDPDQLRCGELCVLRCRPPTYPRQLMLAVFDLPSWSTGDDDHLVPQLVVEDVGTHVTA
jgi:hypothetical protein